MIITGFQQADAGPEQEDWCNFAEVYLFGNYPNTGYTPAWSQIAGPPATIFQVGNEAVADDLVPGATYSFVYTLTNGPCTSSDTIIIVNWAPPTPSVAGFDQVLCNATTFTLEGNIATIGQGTWTQISGPSCTFTDIHNPAMVVTGVTPGEYAFVWSIANGVCQPSVDEVLITVNPLAVAYAGPDDTLCPNTLSYTLTAATASNYDHLHWTSTGTGYFDDISIQNPTYYPSAGDVLAGSVELTLTAYGLSPCPPASDNMILLIQDTEEPVITINCSTMDQTLMLNANCEITIPTFTGSIQATDNCTPFAQLTITQVPAAGELVASAHNGTVTVIITVTDLAGNDTECQVVLTAVDLTAPVITNCENLDQNVVLDANCNIAIPNLPDQVTVNENCGPLTYTMSVEGSPVLVGDLFASSHGSTIDVLLTVTDANNGTATCLVTLTGVDETTPTIVAVPGGPWEFALNQYPAYCTLTIPDLTGANYVTSDDNCEFTLTQDPPAGTVVDAIHGQLINVVVTATDNAQLNASCTVVIEAVDANAPTVDVPRSDIFVVTDEDLCSAVVNYVAPTFLDNCTFTVTQTAGLPSGSAFPKGATLCTYQATDAAGNFITSSFTVNVYDEQVPEITCTDNITVNNDPGLCGAIVAYPAPQAWDNCPNWTVTQIAGLASGAVFPVGTTVNTFRVSDGVNTATCSFTVTVVDNEAPVVNCPPLVIFPNATGECGTPTVPLVPPTAVDNCGGQVIIQAIEPNYYELGNNYVDWIVSDILGNISICTQVVEIIDTEDPIVDCPDNITVTIGVDETFAVIPNIGQATATDNCWVATIYNNAPANNEYPAGFTQVTWTAVDGLYNEGTCVQTIYVINPNYPAITCPGNVVKNTDPGLCTAVVNNIDPTAVGGNGTTYSFTLAGATVVAETQGTASGQVFNKGVTTVTYTAINTYGPPANCSFTVTVEDHEAPVITCPVTVTVNVGAGTCTATVLPAALGTPTITDNCGGEYTWVRSGMPTGNVYPKGNTTITYIGFDASGNSDTCTQIVTVVDNIKPTFTSVPNNVTGFCDLNLCTKSGIIIPIATASDNCDPNITVTNTGLITSGVYPRGVTNIIWTATDLAGNTATALTTVTITDNQMPNILCGGNKTAFTDLNHCYATISVDPASVYDNCTFTLSYIMTGATTLSGPMQATGNSFQFNKGVTTMTFRITDAQGNVNNCSFTVTVTDNQKPTVTCPPNITVNADAGVCYATGIILGDAIYADNCGTATPVVTGIPVDGHYPKGVTTITYAVSDLSGNAATPCTQTVTVVDNVPPFFTSCPANVTVYTNTGCTATNVDLGLANADDICDGEIYVYNDAPSAFPLGNTTVTYTATDMSGNVASCTQVVTVIDNVNPIITACAADKTVAANHPAVGNDPAYYGPITQSWLGAPTINENCGIASIVADIPYGGNFPVGTTTVIWVVTDNSGNSATCSQLVTVTDYVAGVNQINGRLAYGNTLSSPMTNSTVNLIQNNNIVASTTTDQNGDYTFTDLNTGAYTIEGEINKPWGGGNATDALLILRHFTQIQSLVDLPKYAADVNGNGYINALDALLVAQRFIQTIPSFPVGDWITDHIAVDLNGNSIIDFTALCFGDVNGSYVPPSVKIPATVELTNSGNLYINSFEEFDLPINATSELTTGAVSMVINYPANLFDVTGVSMADPSIDNMIYNVNNGSVRLAWYTTDKLTLNSNEALLTLKLKAKDLSRVTSDVALSLDGVSEIADETGRVLQVDLNMPKLSLYDQQANVSVYPNPFKNKTEFVYTLTEQANVNIKVYDMLGNEVSTLMNETQNANTYRLTFDASKLLPGVYTYKVYFNTNKGEQVRTGRLVITK